MSGTKAGAQKAKQTNLQNDPDFYTKLAGVGGRYSKRGGFASTKVGADGLTGPERAKMMRQKQLNKEES